MVDVVIVGGGPAGAATAIALQNLGISCLVIDAGKTGDFKPGESLPPNASHIINGLGIGSLLQLPQHVTYLGNTVVWGNNSPANRYFLNEPLGNGWHLNRSFFEKQLRHEAESKRVVWQEEARFTDVIYEHEAIQICYTDNSGQPLQQKALFVVDCSGRASVVAKKMGIKKQVIDRLVAFCFILKQEPGNIKGFSFIEAIEDGYWYAAPINNGQIVVNYMTDSDLHTPKPNELPQWLYKKIKSAPHLAEHLKISHNNQLENVQVKTASTSFLEQVCGEQWMAVGDALCTFDPLTSFGITFALSGSYHAALALQACLKGDAEKMQAYVAAQQDTFNKSMQMLLAQYQLEQRWSTYPFWQRRHAT